ncbi:6286_t:CDS:2 [Gigaspora margarita]|uniref:6286_t:CDS:1 n=1 Tax=Gigaspora margarita TaxID=4874 RepID=A0ABN7VCQ7_GIGMA|nr:6286_t:CDS:2 [Gigaspora margarita]
MTVKQKIQDKEGKDDICAHSKIWLIGIPVNIQKLVYLTKELRNEETLDCLGFQNEGNMFLFSCMNLFVVIVKGTKKLTLRVFEDDTVESVKKKIFDREDDTCVIGCSFCDYLIGIPVEEQRLLYTTKELEDDQKKLHEYNVTNDGTMWLSLRVLGGSDVKINHN